jgi:Protein of unknown function (DUF3305)
LVLAGLDTLSRPPHGHHPAGSNCPVAPGQTTPIHRFLKFHLICPAILRRLDPRETRGTIISQAQISICIPLGIVIRRSPGVTRWAKWVWQAVGVLPGAGPADWLELRRTGDVIDYHATTVDLELFRSDAEAYLSGLSTRQPSIYVVMRQTTDPDAAQEVEVLLATASPFEAQDYADSGEEIIEKVAMPEGLADWIRAFVDQHYHEEKFIKRRRDKRRVDLVEDGVGDARIAQLTDVYRAPRRTGPETIH